MLPSAHLTAKVLHSCILSLLLTPLLYTSFIFASSAYRVDNGIGYDISYPQCQKSYPDPPSFSIIGVNGGKAFTDNKCFEDQVTWVRKNYAPLYVYQNLNFISVRTVEYTLRGPNTCDPLDQMCQSYNYGYQAAKYAHDRVKSAGFKPRQWWLDIETNNTWSPDVKLNQQVISGAIDYHKQQQHYIGIYSTPYQWNKIAGDFKPGLPVWVAGAKNKELAPIKCSEAHAFTGGQVFMVQYVKDNFDHNHLCE